MLKYARRENVLTPAPDDSIVQAADVRSYTLDDIISRMMQKGSTLTRVDVAAFMSAVEPLKCKIPQSLPPLPDLSNIRRAKTMCI